MRVPSPRRLAFRLIVPTLLASSLASGVVLAEARVVSLDVHRWQVVKRESGPTNYYWVVDDQPAFIRARYSPGNETTVLGVQMGDGDKHARRLRWRWRAEALPTDGSECIEGKGDSAASVYVTWKRGLRWYTLKYVWSAVDKPGSVCHRVRNPFVAQETVTLQSGGPLDVWATEDLDLYAEFRRHFENGDANADVPELQGLGIMTDGDQTHSASAADYADFLLTP